ncbi:MAG: NUDIX domain-containing protein [Phycisphaerales bacterium]
MASSTARNIEVIARAVLLHDGRVLLCRNVSGGYHYLPGGHVEFGEAAAAALAREFVEEANLHVRVGSCALVNENRFEAGGRSHHEINLVFHVEQHPHDPESLDRVQSREAGIAFDWIDLAAVVDLDIRPESARAWLLNADRAVARGGPEWVSEA